MLPDLAAHGVRFVQVARSGPEVADGWSVLDDSTAPTRLLIEGKWKLSDELKRGGTVPQYANRRCSIKFKGWVLDRWIARHLGGTVTERTVSGEKRNVVDVPESFEHCLGFNAESAASTGPRGTPAARSRRSLPATMPPWPPTWFWKATAAGGPGSRPSGALTG